MTKNLVLKVWIIAVLIFCTSLRLAAQNTDYVKQIGGASANAQGKSIAIDNSGNTYVIGFYSGTVDFNPDPNITLNYTAAGGTDIYIAKINSGGELLWAKSIGGTAGDEGLAIAVDHLGNIYITGAFYGAVDFNPDPAVEFKLTTTTSRDIFVAKYSSNGNFIWAKQLGGTGDERGYGIAVDDSGNVYTTGYFSGTSDFNPGAASYTLTSAGGYEVFISKLSTNGDFVWAKQLNGSLSNIGYGINCDTDGDIVVTGYFAGTVDFDPGIATHEISSLGGTQTDAFVLKLNANGNLIWVKQLGGINQDYGMAITTDAENNIYTTGFFQTTADFDPDVTIEYNFSTKGNRDIFVSKLTASGEFVWAKQLGGTGDDRGTALHADAFGNVYVSGYFANTADFNIESCPLEYASYGLTDAFILKYNQFGEVSWVKQIGGSGNDYVYGLTSFNGELYSTGEFTSTTGFSAVDSPISLTAKGTTDAFIYKVVDVQDEVIIPEDPLPIVLKYFKGKSIQNVNQLQWVTSQEINNDFFELERSTDGENFYPLTRVKAFGNTGKENTYQYQDDSPLKGNNYYRLKQFDTNGKFTYAGIVVLKLNLKEQFSISVYPNPSKGDITIQSSENLNKASLKISTLQGKLVLRNDNLNGFYNNINLSDQSSGAYILEISSNGSVSRIILIRN